MVRRRRLRDLDERMKQLSVVFVIGLCFVHAVDAFYWMDSRDFTTGNTGVDANSADLFNGSSPSNNTHFFLPIGQPFEMRLQARRLNANNNENPISIYITQVKPMHSSPRSNSFGRKMSNRKC